MNVNNLKLPMLDLERLEFFSIAQALSEQDNNRTYAARVLGISVRTLQRKMKSRAFNSFVQDYQSLCQQLSISCINSDGQGVPTATCAPPDGT